LITRCPRTMRGARPERATTLEDARRFLSAALEGCGGSTIEEREYARDLARSTMKLFGLDPGILWHPAIEREFGFR